MLLWGGGLSCLDRGLHCCYLMYRFLLPPRLLFKLLCCKRLCDHVFFMNFLEYVWGYMVLMQIKSVLEIEAEPTKTGANEVFKKQTNTSTGHLPITYFRYILKNLWVEEFSMNLKSNFKEKLTNAEPRRGRGPLKTFLGKCCRLPILALC